MDFKNSNSYKWIRQYISSFITGQNIDALLSSFADEHQRMQDLSIAVNDSLTISTASGEYLDKRLGEYGITRPPDLGMSDDSFRKMGIQINAQKQITDVIHTVLQTFFGDETVRGFTQSGIAEPYEFQDMDELWVELEDGNTYKIPFSLDFFENPSQATAREVADIITKFFSSQDINAYATVFEDTIRKTKYVKIFGASKGPYSMIKIQGGRVQTVLQFPFMRPTELPSNTTLWQVTRNAGSTVRFRWYSGPKPALDQIFPEDKALIYGTSFSTNGLEGSFTVSNVRPGGSIPSIDSGYFEVEMPEFSNLRAIPPDTIPPANSIGNIYSYLITQGNYEDLTFFSPKKNVPYDQFRYALGFEPKSGVLKIFLPATTKVVKRDLIGSAHMHCLYDKLNLNGTFGTGLPNDFENKIIVVNDFTIKYRQSGFDNSGTGGIATINNLIPYNVNIDYAIRENGYCTIVFKTPHNISTIEWKPTLNYVPGNIVYYQGARYTALLNNGPLSILASPEENPIFWQYVAPSKNYTDLTVSVQMDFVEEDDPDFPFLGPYIIDPSAPYTLSDNYAPTRELITAGERKQTILCEGIFPNKEGIILLGLNKDNQEGPIKYYASQTANVIAPVNLVSISQIGTTITVITTEPHGAIVGSNVLISGTGTPLDGNHIVSGIISPTVYICDTATPDVVSAVGVGTSKTLIEGAVSTLLIDPGYTFKNNHAVGQDVSLLSDNVAYVPDEEGTDYAPYVTGTAEGRVFAQNLIKSITALGIRLEIVVVYPSDIGLGNEGLPKNENVTPHSDIVWVYSGE